MPEVKDWDVSAINNSSAPPDGFPEGMLAGQVNDSSREVMAVIARWYGDVNFSITTGGLANAYTMASARTITAYDQADGPFCFEASFTNTGAATLNVDSVGTRDIRKGYNQALASGDIQAGQFVVVAYDASNDWFQMLTPAFASGTPLTAVVDDTSPQLGGDLDMNTFTFTNTSTVDWTAGQRGEITTLTDGATITIDMDDSNNFTVTLGGNREFANPTATTAAGQSGTITIKQDATGGRVPTWAANWHFEQDQVPSGSTGANEVDVYWYFVESATIVHAGILSLNSST